MTDDTSLNQDVTTDAGESVATENKEPALVPSFRLREDTEKREKLEAQVAEHESKFAETETLIQQERMNIEKQFAEKMFGADMVNDTAVQEYKVKYPDLEYQQIFGALWLEVPTSSAWYTWTPWRAAVSQNMQPSTITKDELNGLYSGDYAKYKEVMAKVVSREIQIV